MLKGKLHSQTHTKGLHMAKCSGQSSRERDTLTTDLLLSPAPGLNSAQGHRSGQYCNATWQFTV